MKPDQEYPQADDKVLLVAAAGGLGESLSAVLGSNAYSTKVVGSLEEAHRYLASDTYVTVIVDVDSIPVDNRRLQDLAARSRGVRFLCISEDTFHPQLRDAISRHFYACLKAPVDPDELLFWLKAIEKDNHRAIS